MCTNAATTCSSLEVASYLWYKGGRTGLSPSLGASTFHHVRRWGAGISNRKEQRKQVLDLTPICTCDKCKSLIGYTSLYRKNMFRIWAKINLNL